MNPLSDSNKQNSTKQGICDVCDNATIVSLHYGNMWFCDSCWIAEQKSVEINQSELIQKQRLNELEEINKAKLSQLNERNESIRIDNILIKSREIDSSIQVRTDLFNAATVAIIELKKVIDSDGSITNKPYALASELKQRFIHLKKVIFDHQEGITSANNEQKAIQVHLNQLANQLRAEEREKLKLADINYKPEPPKKIKSISVKPVRAKLDKVQLRKAAFSLGISEFTLQSFIVVKGVSINEAVELLKSIKNDSIT